MLSVQLADILTKSAGCTMSITVNQENFIVKILSGSMASPKIKLCAILTIMQYGVVSPKIIT